MASQNVRKAAGERRHLGELQRKPATTDALGGRPGPYATYASEWGALSTTAQVIDGQKATQIYTFTMPHRSDTTRGDRLLVDGLTLRVLEAVDPDGIRRDLILHCVRDAQAG